MFVTLFLLSGASINQAEAQTGDRVFLNGDIETMNPLQPNAEAIAIREGKIIFVGSSKDASFFIGDETDLIDLSGKYVTPGFIESHYHVIASKWMTAGVNLSEVRSADDLGRILKEYVNAHPDEEGPLVANGWTVDGLNGKLPRAKDLDDRDIGRPVVAVGNYGHNLPIRSIYTP